MTAAKVLARIDASRETPPAQAGSFGQPKSTSNPASWNGDV
jgi:hypothetical protein